MSFNTNPGQGALNGEMTGPVNRVAPLMIMSQESPDRDPQITNLLDQVRHERIPFDPHLNHSKTVSWLVMNFARHNQIEDLLHLKGCLAIPITFRQQAILIALARDYLDFADKLLTLEVSADVRGWSVIKAAEHGRIDLIQRWLSYGSIRPDFMIGAIKKAYAAKRQDIVDLLIPYLSGIDLDAILSRQPVDAVPQPDCCLSRGGAVR